MRIESKKLYAETPPLARIAARLGREAGDLRFAEPVAYVYNPLEYAWPAHRIYLERFGKGPKEALFLGMNPGPFGMAQTGVPFGAVSMVRDWLEIEAPIGRPEKFHPKRPVEGFKCSRSEVSGSRLWGWAKGRYGKPERFFERFFVWNYCPLLFLEAKGTNRTPDKLPLEERIALQKVCDRAFRDIVVALRPGLVIGVGNFAETRARETLVGLDVRIGRVPHPSPANPAANKGWAALMERALGDLGLKL